jgi:hypothetical protein
MAVVGHEFSIHLVAKTLQRRWEFRRPQALNIEIVAGNFGHTVRPPELPMKH